MQAKTRKTGVPKGEKAEFSSVRWTLEKAAPEFDINPRTLAKRVKTSGLLPGEDGKWSTLQIHKAVSGDYEYERTRKTREEADNFALDNAQARRELVDLASLTTLTNPIMATLAQRIANLPCEAHLKDEIRRDIAKLLSVIRPGPLADKRGATEPMADDPDASPEADNP